MKIRLLFYCCKPAVYDTKCNLESFLIICSLYEEFSIKLKHFETVVLVILFVQCAKFLILILIQFKKYLKAYLTVKNDLVEDQTSLTSDGP